MFKKIFRTVKTGIIFGILLLSLFVALIPSALAGFINVDPLILVTYTKPEQNVIPLGGALDIPLETTFTLTGPIANIVQKASLLKRAILQIELKVIQTDEWCDASISNPLVQLPVDNTEPFQSILTVTVTEKAPAFTQCVVKISATSKVKRGIIFNIAEETVEFDVSFIIGYFSAVSYEMPNGTIAEIGPYDTADFQIDIENLGNGPTYVEIEPMDYPEEEWDINITSSVVLSSGAYGEESNSESVHLKINPKISSDWNNKRETFRVKFTPCYLGQSDLIGQVNVINFNVQKIGSLKDEELDNNFLIVLIIAIILIILISIILKRKYSQ